MVMTMGIKQQTFTLKTGKSALYEYDEANDLLEIIFQPGEATCAVELTDNMVLRFDWATNTPLSLSIISFSHLLKPAPYGEMHLELLSDEWPEEAQDKLWIMLRTPPLSEFLTLSSYTPAHENYIVPITSIKQSPLALAV
ncbi:MAG: DUF2283 domain-containing protein [Caldilineaceae bacterium]